MRMDRGAKSTNGQNVKAETIEVLSQKKGRKKC